MEAHHKNFSVIIGVTKKVADIAVAASVPIAGVSDSCLKKLKCNCVDIQEIIKGSQEAAVCFALFETVRDKLSSSPLEVSKTRVSNISCNYIDGYFTIRWNCQGTVSNARKTIGLFLTVLHPEKLNTKYNDNIKLLSGKSGDKDEFIYCANKLIDGIKKHVQVSICGKINVDKDKLAAMMDVLQKKIPKHESIGKGTVPSHEGESKEESKVEFSFIASSGIASACLADYIRSNSGGMGVDVVNKGVIIYNKSWPSKQKQLVDTRRIKDHVDKRYKRLDVDFANVFAYFITTQDYANSHTIQKVIKSKLSSDGLAAIIKDHLK